MTVRISLVNGDMSEFEMARSFVAQARAIQARGVADWKIVHALITDDWGAPPVNIVVTGTLPEGEPVVLKMHNKRPRQ